jgi:hypothetical protein
MDGNTGIVIRAHSRRRHNRIGSICSYRIGQWPVDK